MTTTMTITTATPTTLPKTTVTTTTKLTITLLTTTTKSTTTTTTRFGIILFMFCANRYKLLMFNYQVNLISAAICGQTNSMRNQNRFTIQSQIRGKSNYTEKVVKSDTVNSVYGIILGNMTVTSHSSATRQAPSLALAAALPWKNIC